MSNNLIRIFNGFIKYITTRQLDTKSINFGSNLISILFGTGIHAIYAYTTEKKEEVEIINKYKIVNYGSTYFMVIDNKGRHFNVNNSMWYWKWDSLEDWHKIKNNNKINIKYYGLRIPVLGIFPNIVQS